AVAVKLDPLSPGPPVTAGETRELLQTVTQPGDVIIVGPPFVLAVADSQPLSDREVRYVVPMPVYLDKFDEAAFLKMLRGGTVYVGAPEYFTGVMKDFRPASPPIFPDGKIETIPFHGGEIWVVRPRGAK